MVVKKAVEDARAVNTDQLGRSKNNGQGKPPVDKNYAFGGKMNLDSWNAGKCITGEATEAELQPDHDLGCSMKPNCTNQVRRPEDADRAFGLPTVRVDIPYKAVKSVADFQNYGDEPEAVDLMYQATAAEIGITEADFQQLRSREQISSIFEKVGLTYKAGQFNTLFGRAKELSQSQDDRASVRAFLQAMQIYREME